MKKIPLGNGRYLIKFSKKEIRMLSRNMEMLQKLAKEALAIQKRTKQKAKEQTSGPHQSPYEPQPVMPPKPRRAPYQAKSPKS